LSENIIQIEGLGKKYVIGHQATKESYLALRDVIAQGAKSAAFRTRDFLRGRLTPHRESLETFWALKDINFSVKQGEVLGIIGRNGAGKSTLLKILSRITEPTEGKVTIRGRVASLLEVGTGFHQELTGRENIFLNGAILGMSRAEIARKFDEIVAFAEVEKFLDTPVKRYSSGMYVRLAFAVAAHLDPEILIVDEVLAVGDAEFQKKCLGKMSEVAHGGRTVLFVSHNMNAVERLCQFVICLDRGSLLGQFGNVRDGIARYLEQGEGDAKSAIWNAHEEGFENSHFIPQSFAAKSAQPGGDALPSFSNAFDIHIIITGIVRDADPALTIGFALYSSEGNLLFWSLSTDHCVASWPRLKEGRITLRGTIPARLLNEGQYHAYLMASLHHRQWILKPLENSPTISFSIQGGLSESPLWDHKRPGLFAPALRWESITS
jgi:ABC-type polysaccharide/polyol phosphate transport system, ATPase component